MKKQVTNKVDSPHIVKRRDSVTIVVNFYAPNVTNRLIFSQFLAKGNMRVTK